MIFFSNKIEKTNEKKLYFVRGAFFLSIFVIFLLIFTILTESYDLDRRFSAQFYNLEEDWFLADKIPWSLLYDFGAIPGILMSIFSFFFWGIYRTHAKWSVLRPYLLICGFTPIISSLLLVNVVLKDHTGRPRPREIVQFNGNWEYKPVLKIGIPGRGHSFPCGHCSIAFCLISGIVFYNQSRRFAISSLSFGLTFGILMSLARIVQGGHFLSDAVWSLGVVSISLIILYFFIFQPPIAEKNTALLLTKIQKWKIIGTAILFFILLLLFIFNRRPFYKYHKDKFQISEGISKLDIFAPKKWVVENISFGNSNEGEFILVIQGFAPPYTTHYLNFTTNEKKDILRLEFKENVIGFQRNFQHNLKLSFPMHLRGRINTFHEKFNY